MKILITSDNHLGFKERDPILSNDSFDTFEEILITANIRDVDIILQGGDLYHDNRPSRSCISKSIALFKKYCTGNKAMKFKCSGKLNYDDPNLNISIPVLSIHGNHDDPSGIFTTSPMHILESTNLVNYLGKIPSIEQIDLHPIIFEMDNQRIAIYALGHVKDRRLYKLFVDSKVNFIKPKENCFSILMVHQNRREYTPKDYLPYEFLPNWFDLVIYGHEHESVIVKYNSFVLLQSGSTVRTSLSEKEVFDKFIYLLDTKEGTLERIELKSTRKLFIGSLDNVEFEEEVVDKINNMLKYNKDNIKNKFYEEDTFKNIFNQKMFNIEDTLINNEETKSEYQMNNNCNEIILINENNKRFKNSLIDRLNDLQNKILLPMVRLKVSLKNIYNINKVRIQLQYKDKVANYNEILLIKRIKNKIQNNEIIEEKVELSNILRDNLKFKALNEDEFITALNNFVEKNDKNAFTVFINQSVDKLVNKIVKKNYSDFNKILSEVKYEIMIEEKLSKGSI